MADRVTTKIGIERTLPMRLSLFMSVACLLSLMTACGGGGEDSQPPLTPGASLRGTVTFTADVPLGPPPGDSAGSDSRYGARIVDPGDDIGSVPIPKPSTLASTGEYEFANLDPDSLVYLNLMFTVNADLENQGLAEATPVGLNIPVSLADGIASLLSAVIGMPSATVLSVTYTYRGPDGAREVRLKLDFATDILSFDLDSDGEYDDLLTVDVNHDAVPDNLAPLLAEMDLGKVLKLYGKVSGIGSASVTVAGATYRIGGITNFTHAVTGEALSLAEIGLGSDVVVHAVGWMDGGMALKIEIRPDPAKPQLEIEVRREGIIEKMDSGSILVGGLLFQNYASAEIVNTLGEPVDPGMLQVGTYVTVTGSRQGTSVTAETVRVRDVAQPPAYIERQGLIESLVPSDAPSVMVVAGIQFAVRETTVFRDNTGWLVDSTYMKVGYPVWVYAHRESDGFVADIVEFQFVIERPDGKKMQVVVLYDDASALSDIQNAVAQLGPTISVAAVLVAPDPPSPNPPCLVDVYNELLVWEPILKMLPGCGLVEAYPRSEGPDCHVLMVVKEGYPDSDDWIDLFFPDGVAGAAVQYDTVVLDAPYGAGPEYAEAQQLVEELSGMLSGNDAVVMVYVSPDDQF